MDLLSGLSDVWSETWPTSGTWADGSVYASPTWADAMDASGSSSSPVLPTPNAGNNENRQSAGFGMNLGAGDRRPLTLLRTPTAQLAINGGSQHPDKRKAGGHGPTLADEVEHLLPTPRASDGTKGGPNQRGSKGVQLFPTPAACNPNDGEGAETWLARRERVKLTAQNGNGMGMPLSIAVQLIPTPSVADAAGGHERRGGARGGELLLKGLAKEGHLDRFGNYAPAIASHERLAGRPAPGPTEPGREGKPRLSARFVEWMMCLPEGHVTDVPDLTRSEQLALLGNGVCPPQAAAALRHLLERAA